MIQQYVEQDFIKQCTLHNIDPKTLIKVAFEVSENAKRNLIATGIGAGIGGLIGYIPNQNAKDALMGSTIGGAAGLGAGVYHNKVINDPGLLFLKLLQSAAKNQSGSPTPINYGKGTIILGDKLP